MDNFHKSLLYFAYIQVKAYSLKRGKVSSAVTVVEPSIFKDLIEEKEGGGSKQTKQKGINSLATTKAQVNHVREIHHMPSGYIFHWRTKHVTPPPPPHCSAPWMNFVFCETTNTDIQFLFELRDQFLCGCKHDDISHMRRNTNSVL